MFQTKSTEKRSLSERISNIAKKLLKQHFDKSHFPQLLIATQDHEIEKCLLPRMYRRVCYLRDASSLLIESGLKKAESIEEKNVFNELVLKTKLLSEEKDQMFKSLFGAFSDSQQSNLVAQETWLFTQYMTKHANNGTLNELIFITFTMILFRCEAKRIFCESSKVKPNFLSEFWFTNNLKSLVPSFQQLIDAKQSQITAEEEKHLIDLVKQTIAYAHVSISLSWLNRNNTPKQIKLSE